MAFWLETLYTAGAVLFVFIALGFCIFSHELGHFLAAKWRGLHIDAFSLGFKPFWRKKYKGVEYRLGWLPFGGYVELPQIDSGEGEPKAADGTPLPRAKALDRIITAAAGPLFNILSGLLIGCIVWAAGIPQDTPRMREITVANIDPSGPEYAAGLRKGDRIVKLNGEKFFDTWVVFVKKILFTINEVELTVIRNGATLHVRYLPRENAGAPGSMKSEKLAYPFFTPLIPLQLFPEKGSPAEKAGIRAGDIIVKAVGTPVTDYFVFQTLINNNGSAPMDVELLRDGKLLKLTVQPQPVPDPEGRYIRYLIGILMQQKSADAPVSVAEPAPGSAAESAGIRPGDILKSAGGKPIQTPSDMTDFLKQQKDRPFPLILIRDGKEITLQIAARKYSPYEIGVSIAVYDHPTPWHQFMDTIDMSWKSLRGIVIGVGNKIGLTESRSTIKPSHMSGPLGIGMVLFTSVKSSPIYGIYFMVVISFALAIFNLMPFPVLDGGHIFFGFIELIFRRPLPVWLIKGLSTVFVTLLIALMLFVTFSDGRRLYRQIVPQGKEQAK